MKDEKDHEMTRDEIKNEFQLERMILFSDAVFAIVITLMAIEIRIPEINGELNDDTLGNALLHLLPVVFAYMVSFVFIGAIWYQHLKIFSLLKNYDKGLVIRNLVLLFFIGLFPFSASLLTHAKGSMIAFYMYLSIILLCIIAQYVLYHYIVIKRPNLRFDIGIEDHILELKKRRISMIGFIITAILVTITYILIPQKELKSLSVMWMSGFAIIYKILAKRIK